jgi:hypothetical protein
MVPALRQMRVELEAGVLSDSHQAMHQLMFESAPTRAYSIARPCDCRQFVPDQVHSVLLRCLGKVG